MLAEIAEDAAVRFWDAGTGQLARTIARPGSPMSWPSWSPDGKRLLITAPDYSVSLMDAETSSEQPTPWKGFGATWCPTANRIVLGDRYMVHVYDADTRALVQEWFTSGVDNWPTWSSDGRHIATLAGMTVDVRDAASGHPLFPALLHAQDVRCVVWSPNGNQLATATSDNGFRLWDAVTGNPIITLSGEGGATSTVMWSPDGRRLALTMKDGAIKIADATRGYEIERAPGLLPWLNARLAERPQDEEALRLRAGVYARLGDWDRSALDAAAWLRLHSDAAPRIFQAGWWVVDGPGEGAAADEVTADPFAVPAEPSARPRWYASADDPNGHVPLAREPADYLTRVYALDEQMVVPRAEVEVEEGMEALIWVNGARIKSANVPVRFAAGWNTLRVRAVSTARTASVVVFPRTGFLFRLEAPAESTSARP
jgi:hypothetical protein